MRRLIFRKWDDFKRKLEKPIVIEEPENIVVSQWTGLNDFDGEMIFENDIIANLIGQLDFVTWEAPMFTAFNQKLSPLCKVISTPFHDDVRSLPDRYSHIVLTDHSMDALELAALHRESRYEWVSVKCVICNEWYVPKRLDHWEPLSKLAMGFVDEHKNCDK